MIAWLVWIILLFILTVSVFILRYWVGLLREKDTYYRDELIDFRSILLRELQALSVDGHSGYMAAAAGLGLAILLTMLGGLLSPDTGPEPDWAASQMPNYFFQSALSVLIFHLAWPSFRSIAEDASVPALLHDFLEREDAFFWGMALGLAAFSLAAWGVYHRISFLFVLCNDLLLIFYAGYRLNLMWQRQSQDAVYDTEETASAPEDEMDI